VIFKSFLSGGLIVERSFLLLLVGGLIYACFEIVAPFIPSFIWALILSISTWPYYQFIARKLGGRENLAATILTLFLLMVFVIPALFALDALSTHLPRVDALTDPVLEWVKGPPPQWFEDIPIVGDNLTETWREGTFSSLISAEKIRGAATAAGSWIIKGSANLALNAINVLLAVLMAGYLYSHGKLGAGFAVRFADRIGGESAVKAAHTAAMTVRAVSLGVIGTALIQALLSGIGFAFAGLASAPILGLLCFLTALLQIGTSVVWIPVAAWLYHLDQDGWAIFTIVWGIMINIMDNVVKPYFIGLSSPLPFLLIMVGVIGGLLAWGFVGIFLGTSLLAVAYSTFFSWLETRDQAG
jgi:predicted PurR-regulated permease PerM